MSESAGNSLTIRRVRGWPRRSRRQTLLPVARARGARGLTINRLALVTSARPDAALEHRLILGLRASQ
eukprot:8632863-Alexandrium_andersonii.AAC.1